ncbi:MAG: ribonuclease P protein component [Candidatus Paceibacterota bacterium]
MIPKSHRLTRSEVDSLFAPQSPLEKSTSTRQILHTPSFFIVAEHREIFKAGVAIPKKILRRAVDRNALRRSIFDALQEVGFLSLPYLMLVSVKKGTSLLTKKEALTELSELYTKLHRSK